MAVVALLEMGAGASVYAYRTNLNEGFDQGLNESMAVYDLDKSKSSHIDTMQSTVSILTMFPFVYLQPDESGYSYDRALMRIISLTRTNGELQLRHNDPLRRFRGKIAYLTKATGIITVALLR